MYKLDFKKWSISNKINKLNILLHGKSKINCQLYSV